MQNKDKITLPNKLLFEQVLKCIKQGKQVTIRVKGNSMKPWLREGDRVLLKPFERKDLAKGIIVLANVDDQMVLHRVIKYSEKTIWLAGDGNLVQREVVEHMNVIAMAVCLYRADVKIQLDQRWRCILGQLWYWGRPIRRIAMKLF